MLEKTRNAVLLTLGTWADKALCRQEGTHPDIWFDDTNLARKICSRCPVNGECLNAAIAIHNKGIRPEGIWAGLSAIQIKRLIERPDRSSLKKMRQVRRRDRSAK